MKRFFLTIITLCALLMVQAHDLRFNKNGKLKIAQLTDIHWYVRSENNQKNIEIWRKIINQEKPDVIVITGDVVHTGNKDEGWREVISIIEEFKTPFAVIMGNHDDYVWPKDSIFDLLMKSPYFIGEKGPAELQGCGNYILPVRSSDGSDKINALLYCLDSQDYPKEGKWGDPRYYGHYGWIYLDQINWYRSESRRYTKLNGGNPIPSLAFIHIPFREFHEIEGKKNTFGRNGEESGAPEINTGFFAQLLACRDVMGVFAGHAHERDYIGQYYDIALSFGRVSGLDAYGSFERGARIINLYENQRKFDTWITTSKSKEFTYYYPSGITSIEEEKGNYILGHDVKDVQPGIAFKYYEGNYRYTDDLKYRASAPKKMGIKETITIKDCPKQSDFGYEFKGLLKIPETAIYEFTCLTYGSAILTIDGQTVVNNNYRCDISDSNKIALGAGFHKIEVLYTNTWNEDVFNFFISSKNLEKQEVPVDWLFIEKEAKD